MGLYSRRALRACAFLTLGFTAASLSAQQPSPFSESQRSDPVARRMAELETALERTQRQVQWQQQQLEQQATAIGSLKRLPPADSAEGAGADGDVSGGYLNLNADEKPAMTEYKVGSDTALTAKWNNGLLLESAHKDFSIHVGGRVHQDWVWFQPDAALDTGPYPGIFEDGVFFRRARLQVDGKMGEVIEWCAEFDFAQATDVQMQDVWFQINELPGVGHFKAGHIKQPQGLESINSSKYLTFMERAAPFNAFLGEYDPGMMFWDISEDERATWAAGFFRFDPNDDGIDFGGGDYMGTGRVTFLPYDQPDDRHLVHTGASYSHRNTEFLPAVGDQAAFASRMEIRSIPTANVVNTGPIPADSVDIAGLEAAFVSGPFSMQAEYFHVTVSDAFPGGVAIGDAEFNGYYAFASYFLTGEHRPYDKKVGAFGRVKPYTNFWIVRTGEGCCHGCGAWEVAGRYSHVDLNDGPITGGDLDEITLGLNWYLNPNVRVQWNYVHATVEGTANTGDIDAVGMRFAFDF